MKRCSILFAGLLISACGGSPDIVRPVVGGVAGSPKVVAVRDMVTARRAASMTAVLRHEKREGFGGRGDASTARVNGSAPKFLIPGVDDQ